MRLTTLLLLVPVIVSASQGVAQTRQGKAELVRSSIEPSVSKLIQLVKDNVTASGGKFEQSNAHFAVAFSTGHYKADPLGAQAARELATQFVQNVAVPGDRVTSRAWELASWTYRDPASSTLQVGNDRADALSRISALWPTTPAVGSLGGHDTERAAVEFTEEFNNDAGTLLLLVTNTAASVGVPGEKLLGANAPEYQKVLGRWNRVSGTQDGATLNIPYVVSNPAGDREGQLQVVLFVPKTFAGVPLASSTRTQLLSAKATSTPAKTGGMNFAPLLLGVLALGGGAAAWKFLGGSKGGASSVRIGDQTFSLRDLPASRAFCVVAGTGYVSEGDVAVVPVPGLPPERIAEIMRMGKELRVRGLHEDVRLSSVGGRVVVGDQANVPLRPEEPDVPLEFSGEVRGPGGVPREVTRTVNVSYLQGEA